MNKQLRMTVDILMVVLLPMLMAYSLIGEKFHEIAGTAMLVLFIVHHVLNRKWFGAITKGKYSPERWFRTGVDVLLLAFMVLQPLSGILMSKHLYTFLPALPVSALARMVHMLLAYWGYVLLSVHAGTHLVAPLNRIMKKSRAGFGVLTAALGMVSTYGVFAFIRRGFPGYMSGRTAFAFFDLSEPKAAFFGDYLAIMVLFMMLGCVIIYALSKNKKLPEGR